MSDTPKTRTITVYDRCTALGCGRVLHSIVEGERGTCGACAFKRMPDDTKRAMNRLIASAFNGSTEEQRSQAVDEAMRLVNRDAKKEPS